MAEYRRNPEFQKIIRRNVEKAVDRASIKFQARVKRELSRSGSGVHYPGQRTRSSAPGEPPAAQTGALRLSIQVDRTRLESELRNRIGTSLDYGRYLEFGTRHMAARPYLRPSLKAGRKNIEAEFETSKLLKGVS